MNDSFTVTPMSNAIELKPGETYEGDILVSVPEASTSDFNYKVEVKPYGVIGNDYNADFISSSKNTDMVNWIKIANPTGTIAPNGKTHIKYTITVPSDAAGGGQYAALLIGKNDGESFSEGFGVQNVYSMASLIFAQIDGEIIHEGEVLENFVPGFVTGFPAAASVMIKNDGNVHEPANVYLKIKNVFNGVSNYFDPTTIDERRIYTKKGSSDKIRWGLTANDGENREYLKVIAHPQDQAFSYPTISTLRYIKY